MPDPGWYDDPQDQTQLRWWDGSRWTERRQPRTTAMPPPPPSSASYGIPLGEGGDAWGSGGGGDAWGSGGGGAAWGTGPASGETSWGTAAAVSAWPAPPRTFVEAIKVCLTKYVEGAGRASRSEYWYFTLFQLIANILTGGIAGIFLLLPAITVLVRRLHDVGTSAWSLLWLFVPFAGPFVLLYYSVKPGDAGPNAWG